MTKKQLDVSCLCKVKYSHAIQCNTSDMFPHKVQKCKQMLYNLTELKEVKNHIKTVKGKLSVISKRHFW